MHVRWKFALATAPPVGATIPTIKAASDTSMSQCGLRIVALDLRLDPRPIGIREPSPPPSFGPFALETGDAIRSGPGACEPARARYPWRAMRPLFLSLPRSGSTLLQRILGSHDAVATSPEPWLLLPSTPCGNRGRSPSTARCRRRGPSGSSRGGSPGGRRLSRRPACVRDGPVRHGGTRGGPVLPRQDPPVPLHRRRPVPHLPRGTVRVPVAEPAVGGVLDRRHLVGGTLEARTLARRPVRGRRTSCARSVPIGIDASRCDSRTSWHRPTACSRACSPISTSPSTRRCSRGSPRCGRRAWATSTGTGYDELQHRAARQVESDHPRLGAHAMASSYLASLGPECLARWG